MGKFGFIFSISTYDKLGVVLLLLNIYDVGSTMWGLSLGAVELNSLPLIIPLKLGLVCFAVFLNYVFVRAMLDKSSRFFHASKHDNVLCGFWFCLMFCVVGFYFFVMLNNYAILKVLG